LLVTTADRDGCDSLTAALGGDVEQLVVDVGHGVMLGEAALETWLEPWRRNLGRAQAEL
jgi:hypothetical protein